MANTKNTPDEMAMPWVGYANRYPRPGDEGFDEFQFTPEQVQAIETEATNHTEETAVANVIRELSALTMESDKDLILAVFAAAKASGIPNAL